MYFLYGILINCQVVFYIFRLFCYNFAMEFPSLRRNEGSQLKIGNSEFTIFQKKKIKVENNQFFPNWHPFKIEIAAGYQPRAELEPDANWFIIEATQKYFSDDAHSDMALREFYRRYSNIVGFTGIGFERALPFFGNESADEVVIVNLLSDISPNASAWLRTKYVDESACMNSLLVSCFRVLKSSGLVTIVEAINPTSFDTVQNLFKKITQFELSYYNDSPKVVSAYTMPLLTMYTHAFIAQFKKMG